MRQTIYSILFAGTAITMLPGCESETGFTMNPGEGQLNCRSLNVDYDNQLTRATEVDGVNINDFTVEFIDSTATPIVNKTYLYKEMPEIVTLPAGTYSVKAHYGENAPSAWDSPYYEGSLESKITITAGEITTLPGNKTITCKLSNIRVKVNFEDFKTGLIGDDAEVVVSAGAAGTEPLIFYKNAEKQGNHKFAYFKAVSKSNTVTAVFTGTLDGTSGFTKTISFSDAEPGKCYTINFTVTKPESTDSEGDVTPGSNGGIKIDTEITVDNDKSFDPNPDNPEDIKDNDIRNQNGN